MFLLDIAFRSEKDVLGTEFPRLGFELLLLRLVNAPGLLAVEGLAGEEPAAVPASSPSIAVAPSSAAPSQKARTTVSKRPPSAEPPAQTGGRQSTEARSADLDLSSDLSSEARGAKEDVWEGIRRTLEERKKPLLVALLHQMRGRVEGGEMVIACPHQMQLDRLREEDKWPVLVQAVEEVVGSRIPIRLLAEPEKKSPAGDGPGGGKSDPERMALADPLFAEVLREFEGATVLEVRPGPQRMPAPAVADADRQEPDEGAEEAEEPE